MDLVLCLLFTQTNIFSTRFIFYSISKVETIKPIKMDPYIFKKKFKHFLQK